MEAAAGKDVTLILTTYLPEDSEAIRCIVSCLLLSNWPPASWAVKFSGRHGVSKAKRLDGPRIWTPFTMARNTIQTVAAHLSAR